MSCPEFPELVLSGEIDVDGSFVNADNSGKEHYGNAAIHQDAARRVKEALEYIRDTEARLLRRENSLREIGMQEQVAKYAYARAELMPIRMILRGE